jgi:hypothetical protein
MERGGAGRCVAAARAVMSIRLRSPTVAPPPPPPVPTLAAALRLIVRVVGSYTCMSVESVCGGVLLR